MEYFLREVPALSPLPRSKYLPFQHDQVVEVLGQETTTDYQQMSGKYQSATFSFSLERHHSFYYI